MTEPLDEDARATDPPLQKKRKRIKLFRWRGIIPLALILASLFFGWKLFGGRILRDTAVEAATKALGTHVDISSVDISVTEPKVSIRGLQIADPFNSRRNLLEARSIVAELDGRALLEKKIVIRRFTIGDAHAGSTRRVAAPAVKAGGFAPTALREVRDWAAQFQVPLLSLTPIDTIKSIVLDPKQLATVQAAIQLRDRADSIRDVVEAGFRGLRLQETLDSSRALVQRFQGMNPRTLGIDGTRRAVSDIRRGIRQVDSAKKRVEALQQTVVAGSNRLVEGVKSLDSARLSDYAFARGLLKMPTFDAPEIGAALFGKVSIDQFQKALYWSEIAGKYVPPGLRPRTTAGPERARKSGNTVHFPKSRSYPRFLLQQGDLALTIGTGANASKYVARVTGVTTEPALVREPMRLRIRPATSTGTGLRISADAMLDRRSAVRRENAVIAAENVGMPQFNMPGISLSMVPRDANMNLQFVREGDRIAARWHVASDSMVWTPDTVPSAVRSKTRSVIEQLVRRVLTGIEQLELTADVDGELKKPRLRVRSNLDRAIADRLRAIMGEEIKRAEIRVRAEVDKIVERETAPIKARVQAAREEGERRIAEARARVEAEKAALEERLKGLSGGLIGG